ncbi:MAG: glycoside hydrolase family 2 TIM barrel-domain containing protein [Phycisphaerae bacterium]
MRKCIIWVASLLIACAGLNPLEAAPRIRINLDGPWQIARAHLVPLGSNAIALRGWRWKRAGLGINSPPNAVPLAILTALRGWHRYHKGQVLFHGKPGYAWFQTDLPGLQVAHLGPVMLEFHGIVTRAVIYLNGKLVTDHRGGDFWFQVPVPMGDLKSGRNILTVLVHSPPNAILKQIGDFGKPTMSTVMYGQYNPSLFPPANPSSLADAHSVVVPNDYIVDGRFNSAANGPHGYLHVYPVWYRRTFAVPSAAKGRICQLRFGGVLSDAVIYLNGHYIGEHADGYSPYRFDVSRYVHFGGSNTLVAYVDPRLREGWWYEGGGIYRHVSFVALHRLHVSRWGTFVMSQVPGYIRRGAHGNLRADANLIIQTTVTNQSGHARTFILSSTVYGPHGATIGGRLSLEVQAPHNRTTYTQTLPVLDAALWSLHHTNMYQLQTAILRHPALVDAKTIHFGIRTIAYNPDTGFYLDGRHVELDGTCNHQDFPAVGVGAPNDLWWWRIARLKMIGCNAYRCSHNAMGRAMYRACDRLGMLVMDENRQIGDTREGGQYGASKSYVGVPYGHAQNLIAEILRDRNDPCVIMWSLCNEEIYIEGTPFGAKLFRHMMKIVRKLDPTRPITCAMNGGYPNGFARVEDLLGINYNPPAYSAMHKFFPRMPIFGSEIGSSESDRGVMANNEKAGLVGQYTMHSSWSQLPWDSWRPIGKRPYVAGGFVWTGFDYRGEPTPYQWPDINSHFGLLDICGFRKPDAYYYQSVWTKKPMVYIQPQWNQPGRRPGTTVLVRCFSNCQRVELFMDGRLVGKIRRMPRFGYVDWHIPWHPGVLKVVGINDGRMVTRYVDATPGPAAKMVLSDEWHHIKADGLSVAPIAVRFYDKHGRIASDCMRKVTFTVTGPGSIAGTANGDPASHIPNDASYSRAFYGRCMVLVRSGTTSGTITVTARSPGLPRSRIIIRTHAANSSAD